jgi:hypothetical protein
MLAVSLNVQCEDGRSHCPKISGHCVSVVPSLH